MHDHLQFLIRGFVLICETVRDWEAKLAPALAEGQTSRQNIMTTSALCI
jgi:hypothetical protein